MHKHATVYKSYYTRCTLCSRCLGRRLRNGPNSGWSNGPRSCRRPSAWWPPRCTGQWPWGTRNSRNSRRARRSSSLCPALLRSTPVRPIEISRENAAPTSGPARRRSTTFPTRSRLPFSTCGTHTRTRLINVRSVRV